MFIPALHQGNIDCLVHHHFLIALKGKLKVTGAKKQLEKPRATRAYRVSTLHQSLSQLENLFVP